MVSGEDGAAGKIGGGDVPKVERFAVGDSEIEHLVEIAVVQLSFITDA